MPNFKQSKNKMQSPYNLKPVPEGNKGKGLSKLPTEVRNKMGYMMDSSHSFKGKAANNMKTMYMGSVYYQTDPKDGEVVVDGDSLKQKIGEDEKIEEVFTEETVPGKVIGGGYENKMDDESWKKYLASETPEQKEARIKREIADGVRQPNQVIKKKTEKKTKTPILGDIKQEFDATGNFGRRQQIRGAIAQERKQKRFKVREARAQAKVDGKSGKDVRKAVRKARNQAKAIQNRNLITRGAEIARQTEMQEKQGIVGPSQRKIKQNFTKAKVKGARDIRTEDEQTMAMSPKAMKYFNRKNK
jgi:hypothetical protein|tara:strand:+ start:287 stop:1189 length:903 start_codon:yes stop_codon:yes gene_type:complete